jgi:FPC/CPF motif-containing protein YcgG
MTEYTHKTYGMARFHVPEGMYSIEEIEEMLANMIEAKKQQDEHLKTSMQPPKEKNA